MLRRKPVERSELFDPDSGPFTSSITLEVGYLLYSSGEFVDVTSVQWRGRGANGGV